MATQTLEFDAPSGLTLSCKLFAIGSDTVVATASATEKTNDLNRYSVAYTDLAAGAYRLNAFVGAVGGFANELFDTLAATGTYYPRSETAPLDAAGTRTAIGLAAANLDTQLADIPTVSEFDARTLASADYFVVGDYTAPDNASITAILASTDELQTNQGNWLTATGFSTHSAADVVTALGTGSTLTDCATADVSGLATAASIAGLNDFDPAVDIVARVTLTDTTTANTDMRGTDSALLAANYTAPDNDSITEILLDTGTTIPGTITTAQGTLTKLETALEADGSSGWQYTTLALENGPADGGGGGDATLAKQEEILTAVGNVANVSLTGPNVVNVNVTNIADDAAIENATVRVFKAGSSESKTTDSEGDIEPFALASATWTLAIDAENFGSYVDTAFVVGGDISEEVQLTVSSISPPSAADKSNVGLRVITQFGVPVKFQNVRVEIFENEFGASSYVVNADVPLATDASGNVQFEVLKSTEFTDGAGVYQVTVGTGRDAKTFKFAAPSTPTYQLTQKI